MKIRILDEHGTALEAELFEDRVRIITDADKLPQGHPVWLTQEQVWELALKLAVIQGTMEPS